jgi:hypothetical protein
MVQMYLLMSPFHSEPFAWAFCWRREMLEIGKYATIAEIAKAEKINESYVARVLRLTLLVPDVVEAVLAGRHPTQRPR